MIYRMATGSARKCLTNLMVCPGGIPLLSLRKPGYSQLGIMRRFLSITTIAALLSSMLSPLMAAACTGTGKVVSCHAVEAPSCDRPMHQHHHHHSAAAQQESKSAFSVSAVGQNEPKCPMDCCTPGHPRNGAAVSANSFLPPLAVSDQGFHFAQVMFTHAGFSSHTDRGPPLA